jgi:hypothetical protein
VDHLGLVDEIERNLRDLNVADGMVAADGCDTGKHLVGPAGERLQHAARIRLIGRLAENLSVQQNAGVRAEDDERVTRILFVGMKCKDCLGLFDGKTLNILCPGLVRLDGLVDVG